MDEPLYAHHNSKHLHAHNPIIGMTNPHVEEAVTAIQDGYSCAQAVFSAYSKECGLDKETARKITTGLGGGLGRSGNVCGAVTGAILVLGQRYGMNSLEHAAAREETYALVKRLISEFTAIHGSINCAELLGYDMSDPVQFAEAKEKRVASKICPCLVRDATIILDKIIQEKD
ncbi:MAG: C-GCAxxG-C-C family protein [Methanobacteriota archaeon]